MNLSEVAALTTMLKAQPELSEILEAENPKEFREYWRMAAIPAMRFEPFVGQGGNLAQVGSHSSMHRHKWDVCGNRTGKTLRGLNEDWSDLMLLDPMTKEASKRFDEPFSMWTISDTEETSIDVIEKTFAEEVLGLDEQGMGWQLVKDSTTWSRKAGFSDHMCEFANGSSLRFKFSTQKRRTFQGTSLGKVHADEEQPQDVVSESLARLIDQEGYFLGTMTPIYERTKGVSWVYEELYLKQSLKNIEFHNWSLLDNPYIADTEKQKLMDEWNQDDIEARVFGMFVPMGVKLAFDGVLIRMLESGCIQGKDGEIEMNERGEIVFTRAA